MSSTPPASPPAQTPPHSTPSIVESPETALQLERLEWLALWLDRRFVDPALGFFFPGVGDTLCSLVGLYGVVVAFKIGVHPIVIARMLVNLAIDSIVGGVPFLGVIFDVFFRAHVRNLDLINERGSHGAPTFGDWATVLFAAALFTFAMLLPLIIVGLLIAFIVSAV